MGNGNWKSESIVVDRSAEAKLVNMYVKITESDMGERDSN